MEKCKTEITIETDRTFLIRARKNLPDVWCATCRDSRRMVPPEEIVTQSGISSRKIYRAVEAGEAHFIETTQGSLLVCPNSLGIAEGDAVVKQIRVNSPASGPLLELASQTREERIQERFICADQRPPDGVEKTASPRENKSAACLRARKGGWTLTEGALERLLNCLDANRECAGLKYENIRRKLIKYFECRACLSPEDMADETINRVTRRISEGKEIWTSNPANYFYGVARNVLREYGGAPERDFAPIGCLQLTKHPYRDTLRLEDLEYDRWLMQMRLEALEECIQRLSPEYREIIIKYYQGEKGDKIKNRRELAKSLGVPPNALRIRVHRIREKLERLVRDRLDQTIAT